MTDEVSKKRASRIGIGTLKNALLVYRVFAFLTGIVLLSGTIGIVFEHFVRPGADYEWLAFLWIAHGYLFMAYVLVAVNLAVHVRWHPLRAVLIMAAGTVPTMSFVAERVVTRGVQSQL